MTAEVVTDSPVAYSSASAAAALEAAPLWYKDAVIYQLHVRSFCDSTGDGIGDFVGLTEKLDYLQDLGVSALWLLPFYPSPLKDDGYDISNYTDVNPAYGTLRDFKNFLREAHARGLRVITELVLNHTSDQHPWFQRARQAKPGSLHREFYVWSNAPDKYLDARIIFKDFEPSNWSWDPVAKSYYWHRFYAHQPDLNFDNPAVHDALFQAFDFWLKMGVDGMRLDAVPYLYEREGSNCENLPETHFFLKKLRRHIDDHFPGRMLLAEANQWPEDARDYFGDGDECHTAFHFPVMPRLFMAKHMEDRFPIVDILQQTPPIPDNCQWFIFLRNHDELTLEMVTDEERDYMYRVYAHDREARINLGIRRRLAPLLNNNRRTIELLNGLLFSLPGTPVIYYGDEIGMGDNIYLGDRNGVRTPMQWSADRNGGFSKANPQRLFLPVVIDPEYLYESVNVETQRNNPQSLWWWMKRLIALRQKYPAFGRGTLELLSPENAKVLAFLRKYDDEIILVVANLSRFVQCVELDLSALEGRVPVELFGQTRFPQIGKLPYLLTLGPHSFYWFSVPPSESSESSDSIGHVPAISVQESWDEIFAARHQPQLQAALRKWLPLRRWFGGKARTIQSVGIKEVIPLGPSNQRRGSTELAMICVEYVDGEPESYVIPIGCAMGEAGERLAAEFPGAAIARMHLVAIKQSGVLFDSGFDGAFAANLFDTVLKRRRTRGRHGELIAWSTSALKRQLGESSDLPAPAPVKSEQSNTSIIYGEKAILKLFRRVDAGMNPDLEIGRLLHIRRRFAHVPELLGAIEYRNEESEPRTLGVMYALVPQSETAWQMTLDHLGRYFDQVLALPLEEWPVADLNQRTPLWHMVDQPPPRLAEELAGGFLHHAALLGQRTAELHRALSEGANEAAFAPESFSQLYQRSMYQSARKLASQKLQLLKRRLSHIPPAAEALAQSLLEREQLVYDCFHAIVGKKISASRIRCHGDYHLGQVLYTGKDFVIIDFEGEPARPLTERRLKRSALQDVAGMARSLHYAALQGYFQLAARGLVTIENTRPLKQAAAFWYRRAAVAFLKAYHDHSLDAAFFPASRDEQNILLDFYLLEKAIYELGYELNNRPDWVEVPLTGILELLA
ncbi:MAG: maltose alpha-D-glucosyltransferase [Pirellulales bacterium]|nr:maltose alpha-D-glucosyltransferase [Pirellulales bacterium]